MPFTEEQMEQIVAAILTTGSLDSTGTSPAYAVKRYAMILGELRVLGVNHGDPPQRR